VSHLTLIKLAELLRDLSRPECRADSDMVGSDIKIILSSEGGLVTRNIFSHSRLSRWQQVGRGKFFPLMAFDEAFGEWEARTGDCRPLALVPPGQDLTVSAADAQAITELALQGAWHRLRQRRQDKPDPLAPWHWLSPRKEWILLAKLKLPQYGWISVANYWCPHYNIGAWCTTGTHATFIPTEDHRGAEKVVLDSQADVPKWMTDFPRDKIDREDGLGLEFECQLNTPSLARLHQFRKLGGTNIMALRKTLHDKQDLLQMDAGDFVDEGYHTTRGGWWLRARAKESFRLCIQCERAWSATQVDPEGWCVPCRKDKPENAGRNDIATARHIGLLVHSALPEELNQMAAGWDVKETVMTIPFLRACITNMIADQERKSISDGNKRRALAIPEAPWKWFTSYELGFPLVMDEHERPMHPLVELFMDDQLEAYWSEAEQATVPLPSLIGRLQTIKEGWGDQGSTEHPTSDDRATERERFFTSHLARNPLKLPEIVLDENFLSMI